jgi:hypothetical protein
MSSLNGGAYGPLLNQVHFTVYSAGIFYQSMEAGNRVGIGLSYRPARLHRLADFDSLESIPGLLKS